PCNTCALVWALVRWSRPNKIASLTTPSYHVINSRSRRVSMKRSTKDHIRTTHTGSLPRPPEMLATMRAMAAGKAYGTATYESALKKHGAETFKKQVDAGIDIVTDGECSKPSFTLYLAERLEGFESR